MSECFCREIYIRNDTSTLDLADVDIIIYDFTLTKCSHLRKSTARMIIEKRAKGKQEVEHIIQPV